MKRSEQIMFLAMEIISTLSVYIRRAVEKIQLINIFSKFIICQVVIGVKKNKAAYMRCVVLGHSI